MAGNELGRFYFVIDAETGEMSEKLKLVEADAKKSMNGAGQSTEGFAKRTIAAFTKMIATIYGLKKAWDFTQEYAKFKQISDSIQSQFGVDAGTIINQLRQASGGTISDLDLVTAASRAMQLGVTTDLNKMANLLEIARVRARAMGTTTSAAFDDLVTGIGRASPMILDNLGIVTTGWAEQAKQLGVNFDKQFVLNKVLEDGNKILDKTGPLVATDAEKYQQLQTIMENLKVSAGEAFNTMLQPLINNAGGLAQFETKVSNLFHKVGLFGGIIVDILSIVGEAIGQFVTELTDAFKNLGTDISRGWKIITLEFKTNFQEQILLPIAKGILAVKKLMHIDTTGSQTYVNDLTAETTTNRAEERRLQREGYGQYMADPASTERMNQLVTDMQAKWQALGQQAADVETTTGQIADNVNSTNETTVNIVHNEGEQNDALSKATVKLRENKSLWEAIKGYLPGIVQNIGDMVSQFKKIEDAQKNLASVKANADSTTTDVSNAMGMVSDARIAAVAGVVAVLDGLSKIAKQVYDINEKTGDTAESWKEALLSFLEEIPIIGAWIAEIIDKSWQTTTDKINDIEQVITNADLQLNLDISTNQSPQQVMKDYQTLLNDLNSEMEYYQSLGDTPENEQHILELKQKIADTEKAIADYKKQQVQNSIDYYEAEQAYNDALGIDNTDVIKDEMKKYEDLLALETDATEQLKIKTKIQELQNELDEKNLQTLEDKRDVISNISKMIDTQNLAQIESIKLQYAATGLTGLDLANQLNSMGINAGGNISTDNRITTQIINNYGVNSTLSEDI